MKGKISILFITFSMYIGSSMVLELPPYNLPKKLYGSRELVTVSGEEMGALMAQMMQVAHSKDIKGVAVFSSTFTLCGNQDGTIANFIKACAISATALTQASVDSAVPKIKKMDDEHSIDSVHYLRDSYLYVYAGLKNKNFSPTQQLLVVALYEKYIASPYYIRARVQDSDKGLRVIDAIDGAYLPGCPKTPEADGTVNKNCTNLSAPAEALSFLLGEKYFVNPFYNHGYKYLNLQPLRSFNQTQFTADIPNAGLDDVGYYYVPTYCQYYMHSYGHHGYSHHSYGPHGYGHHSYGSHGYGHKGYGSKGYGHHGYGHGYNHPCKVHVFFHACGDGREFKGTTLVTHSNFIEVAEKNNIIMLFPQVHTTAKDPNGCWDVIGANGPTFATKNGPQILAVWRMIQRVLYLPEDKYTTPSYTPSYTPAYTPASTPAYTSATGYRAASSNNKKPAGNRMMPMMNTRNPDAQKQRPSSQMQKPSSKTQSSSSQTSTSSLKTPSTTSQTSSSTSTKESPSTQSHSSSSQTKASTS